jgi:hypothetical protein
LALAGEDDGELSELELEELSAFATSIGSFELSFLLELILEEKSCSSLLKESFSSSLLFWIA